MTRTPNVLPLIVLVFSRAVPVTNTPVVSSRLPAMTFAPAAVPLPIVTTAPAPTFTPTDSPISVLSVSGTGLPRVPVLVTPMPVVCVPAPLVNVTVLPSTDVTPAPDRTSIIDNVVEPSKLAFCVIVLSVIVTPLLAPRLNRSPAKMARHDRSVKLLPVTDTLALLPPTYTPVVSTLVP